MSGTCSIIFSRLSFCHQATHIFVIFGQHSIFKANPSFDESLCQKAKVISERNNSSAISGYGGFLHICNELSTSSFGFEGHFVSSPLPQFHSNPSPTIYSNHSLSPPPAHPPPPLTPPPPPCRSHTFIRHQLSLVLTVLSLKQIVAWCFL